MKKITKDYYFKKMEETTRVAHKYLLSLIKDKFDNKKLQKAFLFFFKRREKSKWGRPWVTRMAYELEEGKDWKSTIPLGALLELENISTYQSNASFDCKYGVIDEIARINQIIASFLSRNLVQEHIEEICPKKYSQKFSLEISKSINEIDSCNYTGQFYEFNELHINNFDFDISISKYLEIYSRRCYLYGGIWLKNCLSLGYLLSGKKDKKTLALLEKFGEILGTGWMALNDITDFYVEAGKFRMTYKISSDDFKDIWNGRVTLPIYYAINNCSKNEKKLLLEVLHNKIPKDIKNMEKVFEILKKSGSLNFSYSVANSFRKKAKSLLKKLPLEKRGFLSIFADAIKSNKFVHEYRKQGLKTVKLPLVVKKAVEDYNGKISTKV